MTFEDNKPKVYLETSFLFYLTGRETDDVKVAAEQAYTRKWWAEEGPKCHVFTSLYVVEESRGRDPEYSDKRDAKIAETNLLGYDERVDAIVDRLLAGHALPEREVTDAQHIAISALSGMDYLLSWNCRHLANPQTYPITRKIIESFGLHCPNIITPRSYLEDFCNGRG